MSAVDKTSMFDTFEILTILRTREHKTETGFCLFESRKCPMPSSSQKPKGFFGFVGEEV